MLHSCNALRFRTGKRKSWKAALVEEQTAKRHKSDKKEEVCCYSSL